KMKAPLILSPRGTNSLILKPLATAINAESYQYNRSFLVGLRGEIIGSKDLNVEDNALYDGAVGSSSFDGEGVPCENKKIITEGHFHDDGLLHNYYTARKDGVKSTGNAARSSYTSIPKIGISNFIFKPGTLSKTELFEGIKYGILLNYTGDRPNLTTGDFSGLILQGNIIEKGEIKEPLNETMLTINLLDLFKKIEAVSKESKIYGSLQSPYVKISEVQIVGSVS
ncbi:MAG: metallopeptidase TldD-related protein, partial [Candidatus Lokiarchaeota archaeon]